MGQWSLGGHVESGQGDSNKILLLSFIEDIFYAASRGDNKSNSNPFGVNFKKESIPKRSFISQTISYLNVNHMHIDRRTKRTRTGPETGGDGPWQGFTAATLTNIAEYQKQ